MERCHSCLSSSLDRFHPSLSSTVHLDQILLTHLSTSSSLRTQTQDEYLTYPLTLQPPPTPPFTIYTLLLHAICVHTPFGLHCPQGTR